MIRIDEEVLVELSLLSYPQATSAVLGRQLDRKLYTKVNKVLEALGGKWNRKAGAHVFPTDAMARVDGAITTGTVEAARDIGWFPTPAPLARELVERARVGRGNSVLEPSAGEGAIISAIYAARGVPFAVEADVGRANKLADAFPGLIVHAKDFMTYEPVDGRRYDRVVMNPPFCKVGQGDHLDHVRHAFDVLHTDCGRLVSVLPASVTFREDKRHVAFRAWLKEIGTAVIEPLPDGSFKESGTNVRTVVLEMVRS